ncbi:ABC transporter permease [Lentibacillus salicampi]|uniref:ABC transporter permease n=1 Tax=Lentibacillus salicampi TaxID=175306 RepID=A0A4Y9ABN6_9BACI|nr:ABC transporter permease [Lentibacillus salicampi]TFJ91784.1 ABC transporter permease [Lentibacillus salicampi]
MNVQRISAIFEKDMKDFMRNITMLMMPSISIILALVYNGMGIGGGEDEYLIFTIYVIVGVTFSAVTSVCMVTMMAEEKEKKTLRGLMLSPASFVDIITGKSLVTGLITFITLVISLLIIGFEPLLNVRAMLGLILMFLFFLMLGIGIGLFAKSVAAASAYSMPVMFLFGFTPMIELFGLGEDSIAIHIAGVFPIMQAVELHDTNSWLPLGIIAIWVIAAALFTYICFKKTRTDD